MLPRKTLTAGIALAAVALIAVPAVALAARQDDSLFAAARASASVTADPLPAWWTRSPATSASPVSRPSSGC
ncbi:hypothetical protein ACFQQB_22100 [Nonomuraea rubra]|uniref:hypothetical protein n=1 Tax=Nonomuraea rubra TaxID=46180 RepID=UPI003613D025